MRQEQLEVLDSLVGNNLGVVGKSSDGKERRELMETLVQQVH